MSRISRRDFIKGAAAGAAGIAALGSFGAAGAQGFDPQAPKWSWELPPDPIPEEQIVETLERDFVIVGAGVAGCSTACSLAENGAEVLVVEKTGSVNGRGGHYGSCNSRRFTEQGVENDPAVIAKDWIAQCNSRCSESLVWTFLNRSGEAMDWNADRIESFGGIPLTLGMRYLGPVYTEYLGTMMFIPGPESPALLSADEDTVVSVGNFVVLAAAAAAKAKGAEFIFNMKGEQLIREDGRVSGVLCSCEEGYKRFMGRRGVILCTGDISGNDELCQAFSPLMLRCTQSQYTPLGANQGEGHKMGLWAGAKMEDAPFAPMIHPQAYSRISAFFLTVNPKGRRFMNEDTWSQGRSLAILQQPGGRDYAYAVFDADWLKQIEETIPIGGGMFWDGSGALLNAGEWDASYTQGVFETARQNGWILEADTLEGLADMLAAEDALFDREAFLGEVERYNGLCAAGKDTDFGKRSQLLYPIEKGPFYASKYGGDRMTAPGGLLINTKSQVLGQDDEPIPGLYAVGNCSGGLYAVDYPLVIPGNSHGRCITFGYLLGRQLTGVEE